MATTTNFGWETPDDTDLVKDGALAIRTLGSAIDTSLVDLKGGTTGQVLSKASNTDMDFSWVAVDPLTILDAKGDLISATAADTPARLAVGTNGQVLTADSTTSTGLKWAAAGGFSSWTTWTPTWTNLTVGNGTVTARYTQDNKVVLATIIFQFGSTSSITANNPRFTLPVTAKDPGVLSGSDWTAFSMAYAGDWNTQGFPTALAMNSTTSAYFSSVNAAGTYAAYVATTTTVPFTFGTSDILSATFIYEAA